MVKKIVTLIFCLAATKIPAETLWCTGEIKNVYVSSASGLFVRPEWGDWKRRCNLNGEHNDIEPETCKSWLSMAMVSIAASKKVTIKLENASGNCESQPDNGSFPKPTYVQLVKE